MLEEDHDSQLSNWEGDYLATTNAVPYIDTHQTVTQPSNISPPSSGQEEARQPAALTEIDQLKAMYRLGKVQKVYKNDVSTPMTAGLASGITGIFCLILLILLLFHGGTIYFGALLGLLIPGFAGLSYGINRITIAINNIGANMISQNAQVYLCSHGVMLITKKQVQAVRWDQVRTMQKIFPATINTTIPQNYILYPPDDQEPIVLDRVFTGFKVLGLQIEREVVRSLLPETLAAYNAGQTLNFGPINVTPHGLSLEKTQKVLPWEKLGYIDERGKYFVIKERGTASTWASFEISTMFNSGVLLALTTEIKSKVRLKADVPRPLSYQPPTDDSAQPSEWQEYE